MLVIVFNKCIEDGVFLEGLEIVAVVLLSKKEILTIKKSIDLFPFFWLCQGVWHDLRD